MTESVKERLSEYAAWRKSVRVCTMCSLCRHGRTQVVVDSGTPGSRIAVVGEAPGANEDKEGEVFVGKSGQLLRRLMRRAGINPNKDAVLFNILMCRPRDNKFPEDEIVEVCQQHTRKKFDLLRPEIVVLTGSKAMNWVLFPETRGERVSQYVGQFVQCSSKYPYVRYFLVAYHPAYLLRQGGGPQNSLEDQLCESLKIVKEDLERNQVPLRGPDLDPVVHRKPSLFE